MATDTKSDSKREATEAEPKQEKKPAQRDTAPAPQVPAMWGLSSVGGLSGKDVLVVGITPNWDRQVVLSGNAMHTHMDVALVVGTDADDILAKAREIAPDITMLTEGGV